MYCPTTAARDKATGLVSAHPTAVTVADLRRAFGVPGTRKASSTAAFIEPARDRWGFPSDWAQWETPWTPHTPPQSQERQQPQQQQQPRSHRHPSGAASPGAPASLSLLLSDHEQNKASLTWLKHCSGDAELWQRAQDMQRELEQGVLASNPWNDLDAEYGRLRDQVLANAQAGRRRAQAKRQWAAEKIQRALRQTKAQQKTDRQRRRDLRQSDGDSNSVGTAHAEASSADAVAHAERGHDGGQGDDAALRERARAFAEFQLFWEWKEAQKRPGNGYPRQQPPQQQRVRSPQAHRPSRAPSPTRRKPRHSQAPSEMSFQLEVDAGSEPDLDADLELNYSRMGSDSDRTGSLSSLSDDDSSGAPDHTHPHRRHRNRPAGSANPEGSEVKQRQHASSTRSRESTDADNSVGGASYETPLEQVGLERQPYKTPLTDAPERVAPGAGEAGSTRIGADRDRLRQSWIRNKQAQIAATPLNVGEAVQWTVSYAGRTELFTGKIHAVNVTHDPAATDDGDRERLFTYDIEYPDGDVEYGVLPFLVSCADPPAGAATAAAAAAAKTTASSRQAAGTASDAELETDTSSTPTGRATTPGSRSPVTHQPRGREVNASGMDKQHPSGTVVGASVKVIRAHREGAAPVFDAGFVTRVRANGRLLDVQLNNGQHLTGVERGGVVVLDCDARPTSDAAIAQAEPPATTSVYSFEKPAARAGDGDGDDDDDGAPDRSPVSLEVGERVLCRRKGVFSPAVVSRVEERGLFSVVFSELRVEEHGVDAARIMKTDGSVGPVPHVGPDLDPHQRRDTSVRATPLLAEFHVGDRVECDFQRRGRWFRATVQACDRGGSDFVYAVAYDDGDWEDNVEPASMRRVVALKSITTTVPNNSVRSSAVEEQRQPTKKAQYRTVTAGTAARDEKHRPEPRTVGAGSKNSTQSGHAATTFANASDSQQRQRPKAATSGPIRAVESGSVRAEDRLGRKTTPSSHSVDPKDAASSAGSAVGVGGTAPVRKPDSTPAAPKMAALPVRDAVGQGSTAASSFEAASGEGVGHEPACGHAGGNVGTTDTSVSLQRSVNPVHSDDDDDSQATEEFQASTRGGGFDLSDSRFSFALDQTADSTATAVDDDVSAVSRRTTSARLAVTLEHVPEDETA